MKLAPDLPRCNYSSDACRVSFKPKDLASPVRESGDCSWAIALATLEKWIFHFDLWAPVNVSINQMLGGVQSDFHRCHLPEAEVRGGWPKCESQQADFLCQDLWSRLKEHHAAEGSFVNRVGQRSKRDRYKSRWPGKPHTHSTDFITTKLYRTWRHQSSQCTDRAQERTKGQVQEIDPSFSPLLSCSTSLLTEGREGGAETELSCRQKVPPETALKQNQQDWWADRQVTAFQEKEISEDLWLFFFF